MAISEGFCCPQTYHRVLLLSVIIRIHTYNTIHTQPSKHFRVHYPSTHVLTTNQRCTHTLTLSQRYTFSPYTNSHTHTVHTHTCTERRRTRSEIMTLRRLGIFMKSYIHSISGMFFHSETSKHKSPILHWLTVSA